MFLSYPSYSAVPPANIAEDFNAQPLEARVGVMLTLGVFSLMAIGICAWGLISNARADRIRPVAEAERIAFV